MRIIVPTCDAYQWLVPGFAYLFNRFWPTRASVTVLGFGKGPLLPGNFCFESMAERETLAWTDHLRQWVESQNDESILILLDDYWLRAPVKVAWVDAGDRLLRTGQADKIDLNANMRGKLNAKRGYFPSPAPVDGWIQSSPDSIYRATTQPSIWRRDWLVHLLAPGRTIWQFETMGDERACDMRVLAPDVEMNSVVPFANMVKKGNVNLSSVRKITRLPDADIKALMDLGYLWMLESARA